MSNTKTEASRLASALDAINTNNADSLLAQMAARSAAAELRRLDAEEQGLTDCVIRQGELLRNVVIAVRGLPPENMGWSSHNAPELVRALVAERDQLRAQLSKAVAEERGACAALENEPGIYTKHDLAEAIRARSNT